MKKAQISVELLFTVGFVVFIFIILLIFTMERKYDVGKMEITLDEKAECYRLSNLISGVYTSGSGTGITAKLKYDTEINGDEGNIFVGEGRFFCTIPINSITDSVASNFNLNKGIITINNTDATVVIKNA